MGEFDLYFGSFHVPAKLSKFLSKNGVPSTGLHVFVLLHAYQFLIHHEESTRVPHPAPPKCMSMSTDPSTAENVQPEQGITRVRRVLKI